MSEEEPTAGVEPDDTAGSSAVGEDVGAPDREPSATSTPPPIRVVVADDHPMWREGVARDLAEAGHEVVATAADGRAAVARTLAVRPDVLVLDLNLPLVHGVEVCRAVRAAEPDVRILVLSASGEPDDVLQAVKEGATGYLVKSAGREEFLEAVAATAAGRPVFTAGLAGLVLGEYRRMAAHRRPTGPPAPELTPREVEVLRLVATGMSYRQIAQDLSISHRTVQNHVANTLGKLQLHNRVQLARYAVARGLSDPESHAPTHR